MAGSRTPLARDVPGELATALAGELADLQNEEQAAHLMRFFKTGPGQYGAGDRFLGLKVPVTRTIAKPYRNRLTRADYAQLLDSEWHEVRLAALFLMGDEAKRLGRCGDAPGLETLFALYDAKLERVNNWDLVDLSVNEIMTPYWKAREATDAEIRCLLGRWADSGHLWRQRAAMVATLSRQRAGSLGETFWLAECFIDHPHDLMHKASGWMLREAGKRDIEALRAFLGRFHTLLPRTALRYAIERMDKDERLRWMRK